jgi:hypothetical protein
MNDARSLLRRQHRRRGTACALHRPRCDGVGRQRAPGPSPLETKHLLRDPGDRVHARAIRREVDRRERAPLGLDIVLRFARDSPLEEAVTSEPVSEVQN